MSYVPPTDVIFQRIWSHLLKKSLIEEILKLHFLCSMSCVQGVEDIEKMSEKNDREALAMGFFLTNF